MRRSERLVIRKIVERVFKYNHRNNNLPGSSGKILPCKYFNRMRELIIELLIGANPIANTRALVFSAGCQDSHKQVARIILGLELLQARVGPSKCRCCVPSLGDQVSLPKPACGLRQPVKVTCHLRRHSRVGCRSNWCAMKEQQQWSWKPRPPKGGATSCEVRLLSLVWSLSVKMVVSMRREAEKPLTATTSPALLL